MTYNEDWEERERWECRNDDNYDPNEVTMADVWEETEQEEIEDEDYD